MLLENAFRATPAKGVGFFQGANWDVSEVEQQKLTAIFAYDLITGGGSDTSFAAFVYTVGSNDWCVQFKPRLRPSFPRVTLMMAHEAQKVLTRPAGDQFSEDILDPDGRLDLTTESDRAIYEALVDGLKRDCKYSLESGKAIIPDPA